MARQANHDFRRHPSFGDYCSGLMASPNCPFARHHKRQLEGLIVPRLLAGFDEQTLCWYPPQQLAAVVLARRVKAELEAEQVKQDRAKLEAAFARTDIELERVWARMALPNSVTADC